MKPIFKKIFILSVLIQAVTAMVLFSQLPAKDQVSDTVKCKADSKQSYALYLPEKYDSKKSWPVIMIFDPSARGKTGVSTFIEAGRKYGFILACSNNSHNGPVADNFIAAAAMFQDLEERLTIDQKRIYTAGFSGGSRFALSLAVKERKIAGVIGCGAGLPNDRNFQPSAVSDFVYYGTSGKRDMNYPEMNDLTVFFNNRTRVTFYLRTFNGGHQWPDTDIATDAVEWLVVQSMNKKVIPADEKFLSYVEKKTETFINSEISGGNATDAARYIRFAARDFPGSAFATSLSQKLSALENSQDYKTAARKWSKTVENERESEEKYLNYIEVIANSVKPPDTAAVWWRMETKALIRLRDKDNLESSQMASRVMNFISILCSEQGTSFYRNKLYGHAALMFEICTSSDSENSNNYYNLSKSLAAAGKSKEALTALSGAISHGFTARKSIESDPVFGNIRNEAKYKEIMNKMK
jgi:dienelactone hydrolase